MVRQLCLVLSSVAIAALLWGQSATGGLLTGTVTDPTGAAIPGATMQAKNLATGVVTSAQTDSHGGYSFANMPPGTYQLAVRANGFRTLTVPSLAVQVAKSQSLNLKMALGEASQTVEVTAAGAAAQLQTAGSTLGNVIGQEKLLDLPTRTRSASELLFLQPATTPDNGSDAGASVGGAMNDQTTYTLNGIDVTNNSDNSTVSNSLGAQPTIAIPVEMLDEFRVGVAGSGASFGRSSGGQVAMVSRRGTNAYHGEIYDFLQNSSLNANSWDNNSSNLRRPPVQDNRFGFRVGGPLQKNKTFLFTNFEERHFNQQLGYTRTVPTASLRAGTITFPDANGTLQTYKLASAQVCGPSGTGACDPRGLGISPSVQALWALDPPGNDPSLGDGYNTTGWRGNVPAPLQDKFGSVRLDRQFGPNWQLSGSFLYSDEHSFDTFNVDIRNPAAPVSLSALPTWNNVWIANLTGQITPHLLNVFAFGSVRNRYGQNRQTIQETANELKLPGTQGGSGLIAITPEAVNGPIIMNNSIRNQFNDNLDTQLNDDLTWIRGSHLVQMGLHLQRVNQFHVHTGKLGGAVNSYNAVMGDNAGAATFLSIPNADQPEACSATIKANCLPANFAGSWNNLYASILGLMDNNSIFVVRNGQLAAQPVGTPLNMHALNYAIYPFIEDTWRTTPSLTLTYGVAWDIQTPDNFSNGNEAVLSDPATGKIISTAQYVSARYAGALAGQIYNPTVAFTPLANAGLKSLYKTDYKDFAPRASLAWNPSGQGWLGGFFGEQKTVLRGGFGMFYDRLNGEATVVAPGLTTGFTSTVNTITPACSASGPGGPGCSPGSSNPALSVFRVGYDGIIPVPSFPATVTSPIVPPAPFSELISFGLDPSIHPPRVYSFDASLQRQLPGHMLLEAGYIGRFGRDLIENLSLNSSMYFFLDKQSGQSFAQAFDAVATALRGGTPAANIPSQAWFTNQVPEPAGTDATHALLASHASFFSNGSVSSLFQAIDSDRVAHGLQPFNNQQVSELNNETNFASSNYNALTATLRKELPNGLTFDINYTFERSLDDFAEVANDSGNVPTAFFKNIAYGPSQFDRTHSMNATFVYHLPFQAKGGTLKRVVGGWRISGIATWASGLPNLFEESSQALGGGTRGIQPVAMVPTVGIGTLGGGVHNGVAGSGGIGINGDPGSGGSGLNIYADPAAAFNSFRPILLSTDTRDGNANPPRGLPFWDLDTSLAKDLPITERFHGTFEVDAYNLLNNVVFNDPFLSYTDKADFGVLNSQLVPANRIAGSRWIELGLRIDF